MRVKCRAIVKGGAEGEAVVTVQPINFLTMLDLKSGTVTDKGHELYGKKIAGKILIFPHAVGSSVGAYSIYALKMNNASPKGIVCGEADITTASGCAIADIPLAQGTQEEILAIRPGSRVRLDAEGTIETIG